MEARLRAHKIRKGVRKGIFDGNLGIGTGGALKRNGAHGGSIGSFGHRGRV
jgi:hypothetical protein